jgi:Uma2 family endonuclease
MTGNAAVAHDLSYEDYIALEQSTQLRHEWFDGVAYAMAGGSPAHSRLAAQMIVELARVIGDGPCGIHTSDQKVRSRKMRFATYPDVVVVRGEVETHPDDPNAVLNPTVLVEVLSDSTEDWDRGGKFVRYRKLVSLRDYVLVSQRERRIEVHSRRADGVWEMREVVEGETVPLASFAEALVVDRIYRGVTLAHAPTGEHSTE